MYTAQLLGHVAVVVLPGFQATLTCPNVFGPQVHLLAHHHSLQTFVSSYQQWYQDGFFGPRQNTKLSSLVRISTSGFKDTILFWLHCCIHNTFSFSDSPARFTIGRARGQKGRVYASQRQKVKDDLSAPQSCYTAQNSVPKEAAYSKADGA